MNASHAENPIEQPCQRAPAPFLRYTGPERRRDMQQWDKLKVHAAHMADALLHPEKYNQPERDALVAHFHAIASRL